MTTPPLPSAAQLKMLPDALDRGQRRWILAALMMTMMLAAMDTTIVSTAIPQIVGDLGGFALFSWVFSIYLLAQTVTIPIYGKLADIFGRKPILIVGTLIFLVGSVASAFAWSMVTLIAFRGLQGLGAGSIMATVNTLAGDLYSVRERARIEGWLSSVWGVAAIVGPTLGGAFAEYASWRWIFLINVPVGAVALTLMVRYLHEQAPHHRHSIDYPGALLMLLAGGTLIFGLLQGGQAWPWFSASSVVVLVVAILLISATIWRERAAPEPIMPSWLWRHRVLAGSNLAMVGMGLVMMGPNTYLPTFGQSVLGLGAIAAGFLLASMSIGWPTASSLSGRLYLRIGFRDTALAGGALMVLAAIGFLLVPYPGALLPLLIDQMLLGAGFGLLSTPLLVGVQTTVTWHDRGVVTGANIFSRYLGQSLGAALFGAVFNNAMARQLASAPASLRSALPREVDSVIGALEGHQLTGAADDYLRRAMYAATHHVYAGAVIIALITVCVVLLAPRHFPEVKASGASIETAHAEVAEG
ncbi:MAG TPA: MDR family MFS transporter [Gemmatimonadaceae bacterium]|nr:MDR family MFS transporter [Gemmatimonadaceae bacterium]